MSRMSHRMPTRQCTGVQLKDAAHPTWVGWRKFYYRTLYGAQGRGEAEDTDSGGVYRKEFLKPHYSMGAASSKSRKPWPHYESWPGGPHSQVAATIRGRRCIRSCCGFRLGNRSMLATVFSCRMHVPHLPLGTHKAMTGHGVMSPLNRLNASTPSVPAGKAEATKTHHASLQPFTKSLLWVNIYQTQSPSSK